MEIQGAGELVRGCHAVPSRLRGGVRSASLEAEGKHLPGHVQHHNHLWIMDSFEFTRIRSMAHG
jgi:hypothetical protein